MSTWPAEPQRSLPAFSRPWQPASFSRCIAPGHGLGPQRNRCPASCSQAELRRSPWREHRLDAARAGRAEPGQRGRGALCAQSPEAPVRAPPRQPVAGAAASGGPLPGQARLATCMPAAGLTAWRQQALVQLSARCPRLLTTAASPSCTKDCWMRAVSRAPADWQRLCAGACWGLCTPARRARWPLSWQACLTRSGRRPGHWAGMRRRCCVRWPLRTLLPACTCASARPSRMSCTQHGRPVGACPGHDAVYAAPWCRAGASLLAGC